jgi:hypothetical protein
MDESTKRAPRLTIPETDELAAVYGDEEDNGIANIGLGGTCDYIAKVARAWAEARKKRDG